MTHQKKLVCSFLLSSALLGMAVSAHSAEKLHARDLFLSANEPPKSGTSAPVGAGSDKVIKNTKPAPLGLRYSLLKQIGNNETVEVDPYAVFHSGDRIRLSIQANDNGYLYIIVRGSSGKWSPLFPSKEIQGGNNAVENGGRYEIPLAGVWFRFDEHPGEEKLFIVLSRQPEPDLERLVQSLRGDAKATSSPESSISSTESGSIQVVDDAVVGKIRGQVGTRDIVFEKVDDKTPGEKKEKAVYVVNKTGSADARVVVDVSLNHQ
jgi:hypothetical protein